MKTDTLVHTLGVPYLQRAYKGDKEAAKFLWEPSFHPADEPMAQQITEYVITNYAVSLNWLCWGFGKGVKYVTFKHAATADEAEYAKIMGCDVRFEAAQNSVVLHEGILNRALPTAEPVKLSAMMTELERGLASYNGTDDFMLRIEQKLREVIQYERPTLPKIASELAIGERTFRRRLKDRNVKFSDTLSAIQKEICNGLVKEGRSYAEIAYLLWYADQSAFTRAFKKWHGAAPTKLHSH